MGAVAFGARGCKVSVVAGLTQYAQGYFWLFAGFALHMSYLTLFYRRKGFDDFQIGALEAIGSLCMVVSALYWGPLADRVSHRGRLVAALALGLSLSFPLLWVLPANPWLVLPVVVIFYLCRSPLVPLLDTLFLEDLHQRGDSQAVHYGRTRSWGSVGFIVAATLVPLIMAPEETSDPLQRLLPVFVAFTVFGLLLAARAATMRPPPSMSEPETATPPAAARGRAQLREVFALRGYKRLLVILLVSWVANQCYYLFLSLYLDEIQVADKLKGLYWSVGVLAEISMLAAGPWLMGRCSLRALMLWGLAGRALRLLALSFPLPPAIVFWAVMPLHSLGFAAVHLATMGYLARLVPPRLRATGQTVNAGLVAGLGGMLGSLMAGGLSKLTTAPAAGGTGLSFLGLHGIFAAFGAATLLQIAITLVAWRTLRDSPRPDA